jgi:hypothetical protein
MTKAQLIEQLCELQAVVLHQESRIRWLETVVSAVLARFNDAMETTNRTLNDLRDQEGDDWWKKGGQPPWQQ